MSIDVIISLFFNKKIKWSTHCVERMQERNINIADVENCILSGEIIEDYPDDFPYPSCLVFGHSIQKRVLHVVVGTDNNFLYIITAYFPNTTRFMDDLKTRREN
jgi:hypothetical protein